MREFCRILTGLLVIFMVAFWFVVAVRFGWYCADMLCR
jgi:hypothetical protein